MSWPVVLLVAYVLFGVELALKHALSLGESIAPSFMVPFVVFVGLMTFLFVLAEEQLEVLL